MTLWNPLHVFTSPERRTSNPAPTASFDPSRTGDPLGPGYERPAIGFGDTRVGEPAGYGEPRRRPIGFAPPEVDVTEPRFRTEISFKRHHDAPRASATPEQPNEYPGEPWQTPAAATGGSDVTMAAGVGEPSEHDELTTPVEERVPFYKREISFRRKHAGGADQAETVVMAEDAVAADALHADETDEVAVEAAFGEDASEPPAEVMAESADDVVADELEPAESTPEVQAEAPEEADAAFASEEQVAAEERVPFYKREISFRRKQDAPEAEAPLLEDGLETVPSETEPFATEAFDAPSGHDLSDPVEAPAPWVLPVEPDSELEPVATAELLDDADPLVADQPEPAVTGEQEAEPNAEDAFDEIEHEAPVLAPVAEASDEVDEIDAFAELDEVEASDETSVPVAAAVGAVAAEAMLDDDLFIEDAPAPKSRFSRKGDRPQKSAKRKASRGGKGNRVVGLKIGASQLAAAVVAETDAGHELVELARRPLAAGIVVDGEIRDADALTNALKAFFDDEKLPRKDVRIGLASNRIGVRTFDIVGIDDESRFDNAVRFKAHEVLPVAAHESVLDYRVLEERPNEAGEPSRRVLLVVAPRDQVEPYADVARRAGIKLSGIDLEALGLLRAFVDPKPFAARAVDDTATVVVSIGHESSTLLVAGGGTCEFTRVFDWGGSALEEAIASSLEVHPAEAATILRHLSLSGPGRQFDALDEVARATALDAVRLRLTPFARELVSSLQFYQTQNESLGIGGIVITGGTSHLEGLGDALHQMIGVNVSVGDPLARVVRAGDYSPAIEAVIGSMAVPIGLAIDDIAMRGVNLLPKDASKSKSTRSSMIALGAPIAAAVPLIALGVVYLGAHGKAADNKAELAAVTAEIAALPKPQGPELDAGVVGDEAVRATAVASVLGGRLAWDAVFRDMARVLPSNVWLKSLSASVTQAGNLADGTTAPVAATTPGQVDPAPTAVVIEGYTYSQTDVARLLARLATLPSLERVTLTSSQKEIVGKKDVVRFVIVADLNQTGGAS